MNHDHPLTNKPPSVPSSRSSGRQPSPPREQLPLKPCLVQGGGTCVRDGKKMRCDIQEGSVDGTSSKSQSSCIPVEVLSRIPQQGSTFVPALSAARFMSDNGSVFSQHNESSHFFNVRSIESSSTHADVSAAPNVVRGARTSGDVRGSKDANRDGKVAQPSTLVSDYPSSAVGQYPLVPSATFRKAPLQGVDPNESNVGHDQTEMHTPKVRSSGCECKQSTPIPSQTTETSAQNEIVEDRLIRLYSPMHSSASINETMRRK